MEDEGDWYCWLKRPSGYVGGVLRKRVSLGDSGMAWITGWASWGSSEMEKELARGDRSAGEWEKDLGEKVRVEELEGDTDEDDGGRLGILPPALSASIARSGDGTCCRCCCSAVAVAVAAVCFFCRSIAMVKGGWL